MSGKRNRYQDDQYNLDITYITQRVLAMSFPAQGFESLYRNNIDNVGKGFKLNIYYKLNSNRCSL